MKKNGIDVSEHQGNIDWSKVRASGVDFAILRAGYGNFATQKDKQFETNYTTNAKAVGMPVGAYWYSYATTVEEAKQEAQVCFEIIKGKQFEYPIYFDLEEESAFATGKSNCTAMIRAFCELLENSGYFVGLYMSRSPFCDYTENDIRTRYALWLAEYGSRLNYSGSVGMWQKSSTGKIDGISGDVDLNECYFDYPKIIQEKSLNGFSGSSPETKKIVLTIDGVTYSGELTKS